MTYGIILRNFKTLNYFLDQMAFSLTEDCDAPGEAFDFLVEAKRSLYESMAKVDALTKQHLQHRINVIARKLDRAEGTSDVILVSRGTKIKRVPQFTKFYNAYGHKKSKAAARTAWDRLSDEERLAAYEGIEAFKQYCEVNQLALPYPATYLKRHLWCDFQRYLKKAANDD